VNSPLSQAAELLRLGQAEAARQLLRVQVQADPHNAHAWMLLTDALLRLNRPRRAQAACREALRLEPSAAAHSRLATALLVERNPERDPEAEIHLRAALRLDATLADARANLAQVLARRYNLDDAEQHARIALGQMPQSAELHASLGRILLDQLRVEEGLASHHRALELQPSNAALHSSILWFENCRDRPGPEANLAAYRRWARLHTAGIPVVREHANAPDPERVLTIGVPAADFRAHPLATYLSAFFQHHDPQRIRLIAYSDVETPDMLTARFKGWADEWIETRGWSDEALAARIQADGVDILLDRVGHTMDNRLLVFARKPAPIQIAYTGYENTRGLDTIDYWVTDRLINPPETQAAFTEQFWYLPCARSYTPPLRAVDVAPPPSTGIDGASEGRITFGCFNHGAKISPRCIPVWARVLQAVPNSRLLLRGMGLRYPAAQRHVRTQFSVQGIPEDRILCEGYSEKHLYLRDFGRIDIALDPFPNNGVTTTLDTLWMGVPVIALAGDTTISRYGVALLTQAGHPEWIASTHGQYVALTVELASDPQRLIALRQRLRGDLLASPLCDGPGFTRTFEEALRGMWRRWCESRH
jgi:protein O-GlcNAc transferase